MIYIVSDTSIDYAPGDEIIGTVEADNADDAIIEAIKNISPDMKVFVTEGLSLNPDGFAKYVLADLKAVQVS